jgi:hypothetical protein
MSPLRQNSENAFKLKNNNNLKESHLTSVILVGVNVVKLITEMSFLIFYKTCHEKNAFCRKVKKCLCLKVGLLFWCKSVSVL